MTTKLDKMQRQAAANTAAVSLVSSIRREHGDDAAGEPIAHGDGTTTFAVVDSNTVTRQMTGIVTSRWPVVVTIGTDIVAIVAHEHSDIDQHREEMAGTYAPGGPQPPNAAGVDLVRSSIISAMGQRDPARLAAAAIRQQQQEWRGEIAANIDEMQTKLDQLRRVVTDDIGYGSVLPLGPLASHIDRMVCRDIGAEQGIYAIEKAADPARDDHG